jgi:hypothetical protein
MLSLARGLRIIALNLMVSASADFMVGVTSAK